MVLPTIKVKLTTFQIIPHEILLTCRLL